LTNYNPPELPRAGDPDEFYKYMRARAYEHGYENMGLLDRDAYGPGCKEQYRRGLIDGGHMARLQAFDRAPVERNAPPVLPVTGPQQSEAAWRDSRDVRDEYCPESAFAHVESNLRPNEKIRLVSTPTLFYDEYGAYKKRPLGLTVTSERVIIVKPRILKSKTLEYPIQDFLTYSVGLFQGVGPGWQVLTEMQRGRPVKFIFTTHDTAEVVAEYINSGVAYWRSEH
jgi:hypothetical protein